MLTESFEDHQRVVAACLPELPSKLSRAVAATAAAFAGGGKVLAFGNGGSAAQAQHLVAELTGRFQAERPGWPAVALTADPVALTSMANDFGFEAVFARQVEALARPGDLAVAISTSGRSANVLAGAVAARQAGCVVVGLTGAGGGPLADLVDVLVDVASGDVPRIQEVHALCLHAWVAELERTMPASGTFEAP